MIDTIDHPSSTSLLWKRCCFGRDSVFGGGGGAFVVAGGEGGCGGGAFVVGSGGGAADDIKQNGLRKVNKLCT